MGSSIPHIDLYISLCYSIPYRQVCRDHSEMCVIALFTFPCGSTNANLTVFQIRPIDRIIYHFIAFVQLLLFVGCHIWIFLFICFFDVFAERTLMRGDLYHFIKNVLYLTMVTALIYVWIIAATSRLGEMRWWSPRDRLSRLVPPSIKNATMTKCRLTLLFY